MFVTTHAKRSILANLFCGRHDGRSASCDPSGVRIDIGGNLRALTYDQFANVLACNGLFWGTVTILKTNDEAIKVSGLPKAAARSLAEALYQNQLIYVRKVAAGLTKELNAADFELRRLAAGKRYIAAHTMRAWLVQAKKLWPLLMLRVKPGMLAPDVENKLNGVISFLAKHEAYRAALNKKFVETELIEASNFLASIEKRPLTLSQGRAVVIDEDRNLVVAGAGSGKTSVIVAKVGHLIWRNHRRPEEILMMAFGKHASVEMADRLKSRVGASVTVNTFHALGLSIIGSVEGRLPQLSSTAEDGKKLQVVIHRIIERLLAEDRQFADKVLSWFTSYFASYRSHWEFHSFGEYWQYVRDHDIRTLKSEKVKSYEECEIANWLYLNGINYRYEPKYEHDVATAEKRQYKPDFYLPDLQIYIEHFAVDEFWNTPAFIDQGQYLDGIRWKRETHANFGTTLVETYSHEKRGGILLANLESKLNALPGITLTKAPISLEDALKQLTKAGRVNDFSKLTSTFLRHFKGSQIGMDELRRRALALDCERTKAYVDVFASIFFGYQQKLRAADEIDFEDMITLATDHVASHRFVSPYGYILVDEFQDISIGRTKLLKALLDQRPSNQLFAVGDDWQAIFRFAGGDISLMTRFTDNFGFTARTDLEETFRCPDRISDIASRFVTRNPAQIAKTVKAVNKAMGPVVFIGHPSAKPGCDIIQDALIGITKHADGQEVGVLLIGRYNHLRLGNMSQLQAAFPSLKLKFKTAHASKGLEDDYVVVLGLGSGRMGFPTGMVDDPLLNLVLAAPEPFPNSEERRLFYVALTRAKRAVFLIADRNSPSAFVAELERDGYDVVKFGNDARTKVPCPACKEGKLEIRKGKDNLFVGCSFYPLCEHTEDACPLCGSGIVQRRGDHFECNNLDCKDEVGMCPRCGEGWLLRKVRRDGTGGFLACSNYPTCRYTEKASLN